MFLGFMALWLIFNGRVTLELVIIGALISALLEWAACKVFGIAPRDDVLRTLRLWRYAKYFLLLLRDMFLCSFRVLGLVLHPAREIAPRLIYFHADIRTETHRVLLANSITLTPGTITVGLTGDRFHVHALDRSFADGIGDSEFVREIQRLEARHGK